MRSVSSHEDRSGLWVVLGLIAAAGVLTHRPGYAQSQPSIEKLVVGTTMEVKSIDIDDYYFSTLLHLMSHQGLVKLDEHGELAGDLAESWRTEDARTWTFTLKTGVIWRDGAPVTARDIQFSIEYLMEKIPVYQSHFSLVEAVTAPDEKTVVIRLSRPNPRFPVNLLVLRAIPSHIFQKVEDPKRITGAQAAVGCGPFVLEYFDPSAGAIGFKAFERYHRGPPHVKRVVFRFFKNPDTMILAFRNGEIDLPYLYAAGTAPFHIPPMLKDPNIRIHLLENTGVAAAIFINVHQPPLDQRELRRALALAINYQEILSLFAAGYGSIPTGGFVPRGSPEFVETDPMVNDPEQARRLLEGLGYVDGDGDGFREREGRPLEIELVLRVDTAGNLRLAQLLQEYFRAVGVKLKLKTVDMTLFRTISDHDRSHMALLTRTTPWGMMMWAGCGSGYFDRRNIGWSLSDDAELTSIVDRMNRVLDRQEYRQAAAELQRYYARELPAIPLYWDVMIQPCRTRIEGWKVSPMYGILWEESWFSIREIGESVSR
jgi:peptide/nickel transport system substrate-binding protein